MNGEEIKKFLTEEKASSPSQNMSYHISDLRKLADDVEKNVNFNIEFCNKIKDLFNCLALLIFEEKDQGTIAKKINALNASQLSFGQDLDRVLKIIGIYLCEFLQGFRSINEILKSGFSNEETLNTASDDYKNLTRIINLMKNIILLFEASIKQAEEFMQSLPSSLSSLVSSPVKEQVAKAKAQVALLKRLETTAEHALKIRKSLLGTGR
jgi:hypothetical protein